MSWNIKKFATEEAQIAQAIKEKLLSCRAIIKLFEQFEVAPERLQDLQIVIVPLEKKYAETDDRSMKLNNVLFEGGWDVFVRDHFFIVAHEIVHWLSRIKEQESYFHDPEEVMGFVSSIAFELSEGTDPDEIWNKIYPKVSWHFHNEIDAKEFFANMAEKAQKLLRDEHGKISSLYTQAQYGYGSPGLMSGMERAYQQGQQIAESPQAAGRAAWNWIAPKIDRWISNRSRGGKPTGPGQQRCWVCEQYIPAGGISRVYKGSDGLSTNILLCPKHAEMFDKGAIGGSSSTAPASKPPASKPPAPKPPAPKPPAPRPLIAPRS